MDSRAFSTAFPVTSRRLASLLLACAACDEAVPTDQAFGVVDPSEFPDAGVGSLEPSYGFHEGERAEFYHFGSVEVLRNADNDVQGAPANPMYWFYRGSEAMFEIEADPSRPGGFRLTEESHAPIVDFLPGRENYSPYWEIVRVQVPDDYDANQVKSLRSLREAVDNGAFDLEYMGEAMHCPIVDSEAELLQGVSHRDRAYPRVSLWFRRLRTYCYLFERPNDFLPGDPGRGFEMPAASVRVGVGDVDDAEIDRDVLSIPVMDLYFPRTHVLNPTGEEYDTFPKDGILTDKLPGDDGYSPLVRVNYYRVVPGFPFAGYTSLGDIDPSLAEVSDPEVIANYPLRGTIPACNTDAACVDAASMREENPQPALACNTETGFCDAPPVGFGEHCGPGIARCDHTPYLSSNMTDPDLFPMGLACTSLRIQIERFCYRRCDWALDDDDPATDKDSRCGSIPGMVCSRTLRVIENDAGVCLRECNSLRGAPETDAANAECERTTDEQGFDDEPPETQQGGAIYGDASRLPVDRRFDLDDNPFADGCVDALDPDECPDKAEPDGRMDLLEGTTCLVSSRDLCAWPDSRADQLRKARKP